ncbi:alkaline phosphatase family protein [soil metagenome]
MGVTRLASVLFALAACGGGARSHGPANASLGDLEHPNFAGEKKLVVLLVIDQLPEWAFAQKAPQMTKGFDRALREGHWLLGHHPTPATLTAPGHALLGSGEPPYHSGIIANEWWDRDLAKMVTSVEDGDKKNAHRLRVPGLGDAVEAVGTGAKAVSVSLKDRSAILPLGHAGMAIWYDKTQIAFISSEPVAWLPTYNTTHPVRAHLKDVWAPADPARLAQLSGSIDAQPGEVGEKRFGPTFPHDIGANKAPAEAIFATPLGNQLVFDTALAAVDGEHLGTDTSTDFLSMSLSAHDYVGHGWGHESWESWDMFFRLDEQLAAFMAGLDAKVGAGQWAMIITSDHGASPLVSRGRGGHLINESVAAAANAAASTELGDGKWVAAAKYPYVWFTPAFFTKPVADRSKAMEKALRALRSFPGIAMADRSATYAGHCDKRTGEAAALCMMIDPQLAGEVFFLPAAGWITEDADEPLATAHGSWNTYDREVPVLMLPFGRTAHDGATKPEGDLQMVRISTVLAGWLGVTPPLSMPRK